jgi:hypothetical protein
MFLEAGDALLSDIKKQVDLIDPPMLPKLEVDPMNTFHSISIPCKLEPDSQEFSSTSITDQGKISDWDTAFITV